MLVSIWDFLMDGNNRAVLSWVGGGVAAISAGIWAAIVQFRAKATEPKPFKPGVSADRGSVAIGGDANRSPIHIEPHAKSKR